MRIGVFGGAFNPVHIRHVQICLNIPEEYGLDKLIVIPSYNPPHKRLDSDNFFIRKSMLEDALAGIPKIEISMLEYNSKKNNYTYEILSDIAAEYPDGQLFYIVGGDSLEAFDTWKKPEVILSLASLIVIRRPDYNATDKAASELTKKFGARIYISELTEADISSTYVRTLVALGETDGDLSGCLPHSALKGVLSGRYGEMYGGFGKYVDFVRSVSGEELFAHIKRTVLAAVKCNEKAGLDGTKVFLTALLHDASKEMIFERTGSLDEKTDILKISADFIKELSNGRLDVEYYKRLSNTEYYAPCNTLRTSVLHQFTGAETAQKVLGIDDAEILDAVRYHTTAKADMTMLAKLVYLADKIESARAYYGVDAIREKAKTDIDGAFKACLERNYAYLKAKGIKIYYLTEEAHSCYCAESDKA